MVNCSYLVRNIAMRRSAALVLALIVAPSLSFAGPSPKMVLIPAGVSRIGSLQGQADEQAVFEARVESFFLDRTPVTVSAFSEFVNSHNYISTAEQLGSAAVMQFGTGHWYLQEGANWKKPFGNESIDASPSHPVTQVSWHDAVNYCAAQGKRLPSEVEWEHAARTGHEGEVSYAFGDKLLKEGDYLANVWTGVFPVLNDASDGYPVTSPVGRFGVSPAGLTDMAGNVWEWTADWYGSYAGREGQFDAPQQGVSKVQRGGSFLCDAAVCHGYRVSARSHSTPDSTLMHVGFRCARSLEPISEEGLQQ
ncbi:MAG: formylglycine-generating enzyme family protein [Pseudohongiella sp.]|nr:formylglycine-generating enzyme family protein [Pseudohongiella sp.]